LAQTYQNIEILIQDNQSTDGTYQIELEYARKYPQKVLAFRNVMNMGGGTQNILVAMPYLLQTGGFIHFFSGDDVMYPDCIERCVKAAKKYPSAGLFLIERDEIDSDGTLCDYLPFYDRTFFCEGEKHLPVMMMSGITTLSQIMVRKLFYKNSGGISNIYLTPTDWNLNFRMAAVSDTVYLREAGIKYRVYGGNETSKAVESTLQIIEHYQMLLDFVRVSKSKGMKSVYNREGEAVAKLGSMALRYAVEMLSVDLSDTAKDYLDFAVMFNPDIESDNTYRLLSDYLYGAISAGKVEFLEKINSGQNIKRSVSYAPPGGFAEFEEACI
jgi:glycosyltransferase involved in cell wall biosynthesis